MLKRFLPKPILVAVCAATFLFTIPTLAQVSLTTLGTPYTQSFDTLPASGSTTWTNNSNIPGWFHARTGTGTTIVANDGSSNAGNLYSYGTGTATDRALGSLGSGNAAVGNLFWGVRLQNNTGATITQLDVQYVGEQWRNSAAAAQTAAFSYLVGSPTVTGSLAEFQSAGVAVTSLDFTSPITGGAAGALNGNLAANRTTKSFSITGLSIPNGTEVMLRWADPDHTGADHGLSIDDFAITPQGGVVNAPVVPTCATPLTTTAGTATSVGVSAADTDGTVTSATITGITPSNPGTITLTGFTPAGGVGGTANATLDVSNTTPANTYSVTIQWANNDGSPQTANCVVSVVVNAPPIVAFIHDVQGNGAATPIPGATVTIEGVVTGDFQPITNDNRLSGFFVQEENTDFDADPATSEGIFVFCSACPTNVAEGQKVQVTGTVSEFNNLTEITATTAGSVVITNAGNNLAQVSNSTIDLPVVGVIDDFYEPRESMLVSFVDTLTVSEYFEQARYGRIELYEGTRPRTFNESNPPSVAGFAAHNDDLNRRRVYLDDDDNVENSVLNLTNGQQFVFHPQANGGLSVGTQGTDFFRGGDTVSGLTGILHFSFSGGTSPNEWRVRPIAASPATFTAVNVRPATPPAVGGAIRAASVNVLNYFTTLNVRGADSTAELNRQRERTSIVLCGLNPDVAALMEIENHATNATITDLLTDVVDGVNTRCGGAHPYTFVNTGGALGTDQIRVLLIYRTGVLSPVGPPISDMDAVHNRPPTAQTFDVVDALNPAFGQRFTAVANHSKSKGCGGASGADLDQNDGQACFADTRLAQANRLITWVNGTVIPAAGDPDVLMLGDFNAYPQETSAAAITTAGFSDLETAFLGSAAYSYLFDGQIGHIDYAWSSASLTPQVIGVSPWHINADENPLFDYNDEIKDGAAEQAFEEKPDGSALVPPRVLFQPATAQRASDHDPVLVGLFASADLAITKTDSPDPVTAGTNLTYTVTVTNNGPDAADTASWSDTLPAGTTFVSIPAIAGWSCTTPAVGAGGTVSCSNSSFAVGSSVFTLTVLVNPSTPDGTVLSNTASATSNTGDPNSGNNSATATTTVVVPTADLSVTKTDSPDPLTAGTNLTYTVTVTNNGPDTAATSSWSDTLPAGTTFVSLPAVAGWSCTTPAVGAGGTVSCSNPSFAVGNSVFTLTVLVDPTVSAGTVLSNTATIAAATNDPNSGNDSATATTTVAASADLSVTKVDTPDPVTAGANLTYTITATNAGPSNAASVSLNDTLPAGTTFGSLSSPGGWSCTTPAVGAGGTVTCTNPSIAAGPAVFTLTVAVDGSVAAGTVLSNTATISSATSDPNTGNESGTATTTVAASADLSVTKVDTPDPVDAGANITYTITATNAGPSAAASASLSDTLPAGTTFVSLSSPGGWSCSTPAVGSGGSVSCSNPSFAVGSAVFTLTVAVDGSVASGTVITNTATVASTTSDPNSGNESASATTTVATIDITIDDIGVTEGNGGSTPATFTVSLARAAAQTITVSWTTAGNDATSGVDFTPNAGVVTFVPGDTSEPVTVQVTGDLFDEPLETYFVNLTGVSGPGNLADTQGLGTITDDDGAPLISVDNQQIVEGSAGNTTPMTFTISLSNPSVSTVTVDATTAAGSATASSDFTPVTLPISFGPGVVTQSFSVPVLDDTSVESNETFFVNLSAPTNATLGDGQGLGTIVDDDSTLPAPDPTIIANCLPVIGGPCALTAGSLSGSTMAGWTFEWLIDGVPSGTGLTIHPNFTEAGSYVVVLNVVGIDGQTGTATLTIVIAEPKETCPSGNLCMHDGRFEISLKATDPRTGATGVGLPLSENDHFGYFALPQLTGNTDNPEVFVKILDGRPVTGSFWIFYGGLTDLELEITVVDTETGETKVYSRPGGSSAGGFDVGAGVTPEECVGEVEGTVETPVAPGSCVPGSDRLCLLGGRFSIELDARDQRTENTAPGVAIPENDLFGYFSLPGLTGDATNPEVFVKVLDGTVVNGHNWLFYAGLTDLEFTVTVTDTTTGVVTSYTKDAGSACGGFDVNGL